MEAYNSIPKLLILLVLGLAMTAASATAIFWGNGRWPDAFRIAFGVFATAFFGFATAIISGRLFERGPMMRVNEDGVWWRPLSDETVPWTAISRAWVSQVRSRKFISFELHDPSSFTRKGYLRFFQPLNERLGFGAITLGAQGLDCNFDRLRAAVANRIQLEQ